MDSEIAADFTDEEEVGAEVFDDDVDPDNSIADKTVTLSIAEGTPEHVLDSHS
jgi:E3 ubiquitin-protein ligase TRIP12